jgi:CBS-domain-containing membrane protein
MDNISSCPFAVVDGPRERGFIFLGRFFSHSIVPLIPIHSCMAEKRDPQQILEEREAKRRKEEGGFEKIPSQQQQAVWSQHMTEKVCALMAKAKVKDLPRPHRIIQFTTESPLIEAFHELTERKVLSAPVYDTAAKKYVGFLDLRDLVATAVDSSKQYASLKELLTSHALVDVDIKQLAERHGFQCVEEDSTMLDVAKLLCTRFHRVPYFENGVLVNVISQSAIISYLCKHLAELPELGHISVHSSGIGTSPVLKCRSDTPSIKVFEKLKEGRVFGLAIIGFDDCLVTQTSAHDLKLWVSRPSSELLTLPIIQFLQRIRSTDLDIHVPVLSCSEKDSIGYVLQKLEATRSHRIFVTDAHFHPQRVVSLSDILRFCIGESVSQFVD